MGDDSTLSLDIAKLHSRMIPEPRERYHSAHYYLFQAAQSNDYSEPSPGDGSDARNDTPSSLPQSHAVAGAGAEGARYAAARENIRHRAQRRWPNSSSSNH